MMVTTVCRFVNVVQFTLLWMKLTPHLNREHDR